MRTLLLFTLILWSFQSHGVTIYGKKEYYPQFVAMKSSGCGAEFFEAVDTETNGDPRTNLAIVNYYLHLNFQYTNVDALGDTWCVGPGDILDYWEGDCTWFAFRAAIELGKAGIPRGNIFLATVLNYRGYVENLGRDPYDPRWKTANHMIALAVVDGQWYVLDSSESRLLRLDEVFNGTGYIMRGIINFANYGLGKNNDVGAGFARGWVK